MAAYYARGGPGGTVRRCKRKRRRFQRLEPSPSTTRHQTTDGGLDADWAHLDLLLDELDQRGCPIADGNSVEASPMSQTETNMTLALLIPYHEPVRPERPSTCVP